MGKVIDLKGKAFGKLTVLKYMGLNKNHQALWLCLCDCENVTQKVVVATSLKSGRVRSCGCLYKEIATTHGESKTRLYNIYHGMIKRCYNRKSISYNSYGDRGISICEEWLGVDGYVNFRNWSLNNGYLDTLSIDRIDVNGNYEPNNCRWATQEVQSSNTRRNHIVEINGVKKTIMQWSKEVGISFSAMHGRIKKGGDDSCLLRAKKDKSAIQSGEKGVIWHKKAEKWTVTVNKKYIGSFVELDDALNAKEKNKYV